MSKNILAIDVGTQSSRAAVVTAAGDILGIAQIKHEVDSPRPNWAQQRPDEWWEEICRATGQVLSETGAGPESIEAVASCGQMHGPVGIAEDGSVTTDSVQLWCDKRADEQCSEFRARHSDADLAAVTGSYSNPAWIAFKTLWHRKHELDAYSRTEWFLVPKDFINYRLTGVAATDPSEASGSFLWDWRKDGYSEKLAAKLGVDLSRFAPAHPSHEVIGQVTDEAAKLTGLRSGTPVVAGGGDFPVSMLGFGIVGEGVTADVTGTSTLLASHSEKPLIHPGIQNLRHVVKGWIPFTITECGGMSMKWFKDVASAFAGNEEASYEKLIEMAGEAAPGSDGLLFYPYMLGERRRENTMSRGGFYGITLNHSAPHFVRAVMEGVALAFGKDLGLFAELGSAAKRILCVGGGTRNELWNRIKADVARMPLELSDEPEAGLKGAALLGAAGVGIVDDIIKTAVERRKIDRKVDPTPANYEAYGRALAEHVRMYDHMLGYWGASRE